MQCLRTRPLPPTLLMRDKQGFYSGNFCGHDLNWVDISVIASVKGMVIVSCLRSSTNFLNCPSFLDLVSL